MLCALSCASVLAYKCMPTCSILCTYLGGHFDFGLALQLSICPSMNLSSVSALSPLLCLCRLDLSQLFAGFKDKEILIELLCNSMSQCITRQLDINRPPSSACVCVCERDSVSCVSVVKSLPIDPTGGSCDLLLQCGSLSLEICSAHPCRLYAGVYHTWLCS